MLEKSSQITSLIYSFPLPSLCFIYLPLFLSYIYPSFYLINLQYIAIVLNLGCLLSSNKARLLLPPLSFCVPMDFRPNTSLHLSLPNNVPNLELGLESSSSSTSSPHSPAEPRIFSCNYCQRKFYSSQALGGHQNAHKLERTLAKKSRELSSAVRNHGGSNPRMSEAGFGGSAHVRLHQSPLSGFDNYHGHAGRFAGEISYGRREMTTYGSTEGVVGPWSKGYRPENVQEELNHLDLSLRL